jgi:RNA methyltransferase, TrmH family
VARYIITGIGVGFNFDYHPFMEMKGKLSASKATLIRKLHQRKHREETGLFIAEGARVVRQILENRNIITEFIVQSSGTKWNTEHHPELSAVRVSAPALANDPVTDSVAHAPGSMNSDIDLFEADEGLFDELSTVTNPQGVLAVCRIPEFSQASALLDGGGVLLAMYRMNDPGNLGTVLRSAAWFGLRGVFLSTGTVDLYNPKVVRSMAGSVGSLPVASGYLAIFLEEAKKTGWRIYLLDASEDSTALASIRPGKKSILVLGSEAHGLPDPIKEAYIRIRVESPVKNPAVESLNASVTASIALYQMSLKTM